jgi:predicted deacylase
MSRRNIAILFLSVILISAGFGAYFFFKTPYVEVTIEETDPKTIETIGFSVEKRPITSYSFGTGEKNIVFVGGIHGGYEWNSVLLAYQFIDYWIETIDSLDPNLKITVIPNLNPDGTYKIIGREGRFSIIDAPKDRAVTSPGRFNARGVDLNRNFDCKWAPTATWQNKKVSAGTAPFSEPEALAFRDYVFEEKPIAVVFWHSQANAVYASACEQGTLPETLNILNAYSIGSGYRAVETFDSYVVTGAAEDWLASIGIPAITVELKTYDSVEWESNLAGSLSLINYYKKASGL